MVDFQSRNTRRGLDEDDGADVDSDEGRGVEGEAESTESAADAATDDQSEPDREGDPAIAVLATSGAGTDVSAATADAFESAGYAVRGRDRRAQDLDAIQTAVDQFVDRSDVCGVVTVGGTGVAPGDRTVEAVQPLFTKALPGFGEAFRRKYEERTGDGTIASRAGAGIADDTPVFCLPADPEIATFAVRELIAPDVATIHREAGGR